MKKSLLKASCVALLFLGTVGAQAAGVITSGTQWTDASGSLAPGTEYDFFAATPPSTAGSTLDYKSLSDFSVTLKGGISKASIIDWNMTTAKVIAPGDTTAVSTGVFMNYATGTKDFLTFQLTNPNVSAFTVYILDGVMNVHDWTQSLNLSVNGGAAVTQATVARTESLEWTSFNVTGASTFDVYTLSVTNVGVGVISGITFETVPEPATWAMLVGGMGLLISARRFRKLA